MITLNHLQCSKCGSYMCIDSCPTNALTLDITHKTVLFNELRCIGCGLCIKFMGLDKGSKYICSGATPRFTYEVIQEWIDARSTFAVVIGPGLEYYNKSLRLENVAGAWRKLGATRIIRATTATTIAIRDIKNEIRYRWNSGERLLIDSRCGAIRNLVDLLRPDLKPCMIRADSTLYASGRMASATIEHRRVVFLGPNLSYKRQLSVHPSTPVDATIMWTEFEQLCNYNGIDMHKSSGDIDVVANDEGEIPGCDDFREWAANENIPYHSMLRFQPKQIVAFFMRINQDESQGFIAGLFCGSCINGPGIYASWEETEKRAHASPRSVPPCADHDKLLSPTISGVSAARDINQYIVIQTAPSQEVLMSAKQSMTDVKSGGKVKQGSDKPLKQIMQQIDAAGDVHQTILATSDNLGVVALELEKLCIEMHKYHPDASGDLERLKAAQQAARNGDSGQVVENLKGMAKWIVDFATKIGTPVIARILEKQIGL